MHTRNNFTKQTQREAFERSGGICECHLLGKAGIPGFSPEGCGVPLRSGSIFYEHINPSAICGRNDLENAATLTKTCWRRKTDTFDLPTIAKSNRVQDGARGIRPLQFRPLPGTKASGLKLPMNGSGPIYRDSGRPLFERRKG